MIEPLNCKCGAKARVRTKGEYTWVECSNKKCDRHTGFIHLDPSYKIITKEMVKVEAIRMWNKMVQKCNTE